MKVLMFGWEFPPHISGGLGTACYGLTHSLVQENTSILFVVPKIFGDEPSENNIELINASNVAVPLGKQPGSNKKKQPQQGELKVIGVEALLHPYTATSYHEEQRKNLEQWNYTLSEEAVTYKGGGLGKRYKFSGLYGPELLQEVKRYAEVASEIATQNEFDVVHAHDWLTFPSGIEAKKISGKPLVVHVHATEYDRSGDKIDSRVYEIEREGMKAADKIIAVSNWTKKIIVNEYRIPQEKIVVVHNGVIPKHELSTTSTLPPLNKPIITFLGRITHQKGPQYFIEAARLVLEKVKDAHFIMAGSGDLLPKMIERVAHLHLSTQFHFTGFLKEDHVDRVWKMTDVYVMPSVSEPFGIAPLEAIQAGVPVVITNQSGVSEVIHHAIKVDFWNTPELANAIISLLKNKNLVKDIKAKSSKEVKKINWGRAAKKVNKVYDKLVHTQ